MDPMKVLDAEYERTIEGKATALRALERIGKKAIPYRQRCLFGRGHTWAWPAGASGNEEECYCATCGSVSSLHPLSR